MAFGVTLPDDVGNYHAGGATAETAHESPPGQSSDQAPSGAHDLEVSTKAAQTEANEQPDPTKGNPVLDLDKLERFRLGGKEWNPKDLRTSLMAHQDYTKKTMELAEARKYAENFEQDLQTLLNNPNRFQEFRQVYPKFYVEMAERLLNQATSRNASQNTQNHQADKPDPRDRRIAEIEGRFAEWEKSQHAVKVQEIQSWLNNQFESLEKKYPYANAEAITARADVLANRGTQVTEQVLEKLFKANHEELKGKMEKMYKAKVDEQIKVGQKAKDMGSGGGVPGAAPRGFKTIKEATSAWLNQIESNR